MKNLMIALLLVSTIILTSCRSGVGFEEQDILAQVSTIDALLDGVYDGTVSCGDLKNMGNFGIGTFDALEGEMIVLDGDVYQVRTDGIAYKVSDSEKTPFAAVTFFNRDMKLKLPSGLTFLEVEKMIDKYLVSDNLFYAIKITGNFETMKTRSVPKQKKPYPQLKEVVKHQKVFNFENTKGTIVGFKCPPYVKGINVTGYHLHFLTEDLKKGGHILDFKAGEITVEIDTKTDFYMVLPNIHAFRKSNLQKDRTTELHKVEK